MLRRVFPLLTLLILAAAAQAAPDIFMRVEGIPGDATDAQHRDEIVVASYSFNIAQSASPSRGGGASAALPSRLSLSQNPWIRPRLASQSPVSEGRYCRGSISRCAGPDRLAMSTCVSP